MIRLSRILALGLALVACSPQQQQQEPEPPVASCAPTVSHLVLAQDADDLLRHHLQSEVGRNIREVLRAQPMISSPRREVVGGHLEVHVANPADVSAAIERIRRLGDPPMGTIDGQNSFEVESKGSVIEVRFTQQALQELRAEALASSLEAVKLRVSASDLKAAPAILAPGRICVDAPGFSADELDRLARLLTRFGALTFNLVDEEETSRLPFDPVEWLEGEERRGRIALPNDSMDGQLQVIETDSIITGSDLSGAMQGFDQSDRPSISFQLHPAGAQRFGRVTTENIGRPFAIVLDDRIVTAPHIQSPIMGGSGQITGQFTIEEAEDLAIVLRSGALPAPLAVIERVVAN